VCPGWFHPTGSSQSHQLTVVTREEGLRLVKTPAIIQEYANHDGVLFKVYVLGDHIRVFRRESLPNLGPNARSIAFDSQKAYPRDRDFEAQGQGQGHAEGAARRRPSGGGWGDGVGGPEVCPAVVSQAAEQLKRHLGLELFGFDLIVARGTGELLVVDVNYFPSFKEVEDFPARLRAFLRAKAAVAASPSEPGASRGGARG
jgi:hypothetical protein